MYASRTARSPGSSAPPGGSSVATMSIGASASSRKMTAVAPISVGMNSRMRRIGYFSMCVGPRVGAAEGGPAASLRVPLLPLRDEPGDDAAGIEVFPVQIQLRRRDVVDPVVED